MTDGFQPGGSTPIGNIFGGAGAGGGSGSSGGGGGGFPPQPGGQPSWSTPSTGMAAMMHGSLAQRRPRASLSANLGALGGLGLAGGFVSLVSQLVHSHRRLVGGIVGAVMVVVGLILGRILQERSKTAATILASLGATLLLGTLLIQGSNKWLPVVFLALLAVVHLIMWGALLRDRPWLFAVGVLAIQVAIVAAVGIGTAKSLADDFGESRMKVGPIDLGPTQKAPAVASTIVGIIMLIVARQLAKGGKQGLATPLLFGGAIGGAAGAAVVANEGGSWLPIITTLISGLVLLLIGSDLGRRGTSWAGTALTGGGIVAAVAQALKSSPKGIAVAVLVIGAVLVGLAAATAKLNPSAPEADAG
jgi:hypothetical protein